MRIFVTGATGLVGAHSAAALLDAGHELRLLVRNPDRVPGWFARFGHTVEDIVVGDMTDADLLAESLPGCDGVLHAAAVTSIDPGVAGEMLRANTGGIDAVLGTAHRLGISRLVYVSSLAVLSAPGVEHVDETAPLANPTDPYGHSKRACEDQVRHLQGAGVPVQITYPGGVYAPHDPKLSESNRSLGLMLRFVPRTTSGLTPVDARDLGEMHRHLLEVGCEADPTDARFLVANRLLRWTDLHTILQELTGRKIPAPWIPGGALRALGAMVDVSRKVVPLKNQFSKEAMRYATQWPDADASRVVDRTGVGFRPVRETLEETIRWMFEAGHLEAGLVGDLASAESARTDTR